MRLGLLADKKGCILVRDSGQARPDLGEGEVVLLEALDESQPGEMTVVVARLGSGALGRTEQAGGDVEAHRPWRHVGQMGKIGEAVLAHLRILTAERAAVNTQIGD